MDMDWHNPGDAEPWCADKERDALVAEVESLRATLTRVRDLHSETSPISGGCPTCMQDHPCATMRLLDALDG